MSFILNVSHQWNSEHGSISESEMFEKSKIALHATKQIVEGIMTSP
jgi:hypothetical protein